MSDISAWSATAGNNNEASPDGWPEGMAPSGMNNSARENMASIRSYYAAPEWRVFGKHTNESPAGDEHTVAYASATTFTTAAGDGDTTAIYHANRRVRAVGTTTTTIYGTIQSSAHGAQTTVTVTWDSGTFANDTDLVISLGPAADTIYQPSAAVEDVITTRGDLIRGDASGDDERLALGNAGEVLSSDGTDATWASRVTAGTAAAAPGDFTTAQDFTGIPASTKRIAILFDALSLSGTDDILVQIGDSAGIETSGYVSSSTAGAGAQTTSTSTSGFVIRVANAAASVSGVLEILKVDSLDWVASGTHTTSTATGKNAGRKTLSDTLTQVRVTRTGTNTFDNGQVNVLYQ